jgi:hypothetical protein
VKPCPNCATVGQLTLRPVLAVQPVGGYTLAGARDKLAATDAATLTCAACGWSITGRPVNIQTAQDGTITAGHLVTDQHPPAAAPDTAHPSGGGSR